MEKKEWGTPSIAKLSLRETKDIFAACGTPPPTQDGVRTCIRPNEYCRYRMDPQPASGTDCMHNTAHSS